MTAIHVLGRKVIRIKSKEQQTKLKADSPLPGCKYAKPLTATHSGNTFRYAGHKLTHAGPESAIARQIH
jgi:hypothetical protein